MPNLLAVVGCLFTIIICIVTYSPLKARLDMADFQSLSYGPMVTNLLPIFLTGFATIGCCVMIYLSDKMSMEVAK